MIQISKVFHQSLLLLLASLSFTPACSDAKKVNPSSKTEQLSPNGSVSGLGKKYIYIEAIVHNEWAVKDQTPQQILDLIKRIRSEVGEPINLVDFMSGEPDPSVKIGDRSLDDYLLAAEDAAGGQIVTGSGLNPFLDKIGREDESGIEAFRVSMKKSLALKYVARAPHVVLLKNWSTFNRIPKNPLAADPDGMKEFLQKEVLDAGWGGLFANGGSYPTYGLADGNCIWVTVSNDGSLPLATVNPELVSTLKKTEPNMQVFAYFNSQTLGNLSSMDRFLALLSPAQKTAALSNLASHQSSGNYTLIYPIAVTAEKKLDRNPVLKQNGNPGYWDATTAKQANGKPFIDHIISLMKQH